MMRNTPEAQVFGFVSDMAEFLADVIEGDAGHRPRRSPEEYVPHREGLFDSDNIEVVIDELNGTVGVESSDKNVMLITGQVPVRELLRTYIGKGYQIMGTNEVGRFTIDFKQLFPNDKPFSDYERVVLGVNVRAPNGAGDYIGEASLAKTQIRSIDILLARGQEEIRGELTMTPYEVKGALPGTAYKLGTLEASLCLDARTVFEVLNQ